MKIMNDPRLKRVSILIGSVVAVLAVGALYVLAKPHMMPTPTLSASALPGAQALTPALARQPNQPKIIWSIPELTQKMFPGSCMTVTATFESNQNLSDVVISITPSLNTLVSPSPNSFPVIAANQPYQIAFTLTAPPKFTKRSFGGTVQVRNEGVPGNVIASPLNVNLETDWNTFSPDNLFSLSLPLGWQVNEVPSSGTHTFSVALPDGTTAGWLYVYTPQQWAAISESDEAPVLLSQTATSVYAYGDSEALSPDEMSATTEFAHALTSFKAQ